MSVRIRKDKISRYLKLKKMTVYISKLRILALIRPETFLKTRPD